MVAFATTALKPSLSAPLNLQQLKHISKRPLLKHSRILKPLGGQTRLQGVRGDDGEQETESKDEKPSGGQEEVSADEETRGAVTEGEGLALSREVISSLRNYVFGFDTFFVTSFENYDANGVLFKGNLRGDPEQAQQKMKARLQDKLGTDYALYLLSDQEGKPCVAVFPSESVSEGAPTPAVEAAFAVLLAIATAAFSVAGSSGAFTDSGAVASPGELLDGVPATLALFLLLGAHEAGHIYAARKNGVELGPPLLIPSNLGFLGSFGAVTRVKSTLKNRSQLLEVALAGPAAGSAASLAMLLIGLGISAIGGGSSTVDSAAFEDSFLVGLIGHMLLPLTTDEVQLSPLALAGWAGLVINSLNLIPIGELDGGRITFGVWGRRAASRLQVLTTIVLGLGGIIDTLALYWLLFAIFIQRGPIVPQEEELSDPPERLRTASAALLLLPLLTLLPYPGGQ